MTCPTCHQEIQKAKRGRVCALCGQRIGKGHKYTTIDSKVRHRDCADPELKGVAVVQERLLGEGVSA